MPDVLIPRFKCCLAWRDVASNISPSALYTETAPPLPQPPDHLVNDPTIQAAFATNKEHICVETPFDVDKLESLLHDHPNPAFVNSVLKGLCEGFWPLDGGEWKVELEEVVDNYPMDEQDAEALHAFRNREQAAGRWSSELSGLLPGMKILLMFMVWQHKKPRIVTDH